MVFLVARGISKKGILARKIFAVSLISAWSLLYGLLSVWTTFKEWVFVLGFIAIMVFFEFLWPSVFSYSGKYTEKLEQSDKVESQVKDLLDLAIDKFGRIGVVGIFFVFLALPLINRFGYFRGATQTVFPIILIKSKPCAVIDTVANNFICVFFDEKTATLNNEFLVIPMTSVVKMQNKTSGPLKRPQ
jgi:hypothetical protein